MIEKLDMLYNYFTSNMLLMIGILFVISNECNSQSLNYSVSNNSSINQNREADIQRIRAVNRYLNELAIENNIRIILTPSIQDELSVNDMDKLNSTYLKRYSINGWSILYSENDDIESIRQRFNNNYNVWKSSDHKGRVDPDGEVAINASMLNLLALNEAMNMKCGKVKLKKAIDEKILITIIDPIGSKGINICIDYMLLLSVSGIAVTYDDGKFIGN